MTHNPETLSSGDRVLRIVQPSNGRGMRCLSGRKAIGSACIPLIKAGGAYEVESMPEDRFAKNAEFDANVVRIKGQPARFEGVCDGEAFTSILDAAVLYDDGTRELVEIKCTRRQLADPRKRRRLDLVAQTAAAHGWRFRIHFDDEPALGRKVQRAIDENVALMFPSRLTVVLPRHETIARRMLPDASGATTFGELAAALEERPSRGRAVAISMCARRMIAIDLTVPLGPHTRVRPVRPLPAVMRPLRF